ncbi:RVT_3 domain-containing protein, partial [Cephalotus follicularis]
RQVLKKQETSGRLVKWSVELKEYDIRYEPRSAVKAQVLTNFIIECSPIKVKSKEEKYNILEKNFWSLYVERSSSFNGSGAGLVLISPDGWMLQYAMRFQFKATNNEVEYEAIIKGLTLAKHLEVQKIRVFSDSQLVINQINGEYETRGEEMIKYLSKVRYLISKFQYCHLLRIPRADNNREYILSKLATVKEIPRMENVFKEDMQNPSITENDDVMDIDVEASWMDQIIS